MTEVIAPQGWTAPQPADVSDSKISKADFSGSGSFGDFEDIEQLLDKPQSPGAAPGKKPNRPQTAAAPSGIPAPNQRKRQNTRSRPADPANTSTASGPTGGDGPILPTDQWTGEETRKRKRFVIAVVGILGSLLLLGAISTAILFNLSKPDTVSSNEDVGADSDPAQPTPSDSTNADQTAGGPLANLNPPDDDEDPNEVHAFNQDQQKDGPVWNGVGPAPIETDAVGAVDPPPPINGNRQVPEAGNRPRERDPMDAANPNNPPAPNIGNGNGIAPIRPPELPGMGEVPKPADDPTSPFDGVKTNQVPTSPFKVEPPPAKPSATVGIVEDLENDLGELSNLLEQGGTTLSEFKDIASQTHGQQLFGLPKYVVTPSEPLLNLELDKRLEYPISGLIYDSAPLATVLRNLETISGIPISIDARSIVLAGQAPNPQITLKIAETDVNGALDQILDSVGLSKSPYHSGIAVGKFDSQAMSQAEFQLPEIPNIKQDDRNRFVATFREFVSPGAWVREDNPATIELVDNTIVVNCSSNMQVEIERLTSKLESSFVLIQDPANQNALANTQSRWKSISPLLAKDPQLSHSVQLEVGAFLNKLQSKTGVTVLVDWPSVCAEGWTPQTVIPGTIKEQTTLDTVTQLAKSMRLAILGVDESTLVMTTPDGASQRVELEVYPVSKIIAGRLNDNQLMKLIDSAMGSQVRSKSVRYAYQPVCQCVIVLAPQTLQRKIEALIDQLDGI